MSKAERRNWKPLLKNLNSLKSKKNKHTQGRKYRVKSVTDGNNKIMFRFADRKQCTVCQKLNNFARVCHSKPDTRKGANVLEELEKIVMQSYWLDVFFSINKVELSERYEEPTVWNKAVEFHTSAKCYVFPSKVIEDLGNQCHFWENQNQVKVILRSSNSYQRSSDITLWIQK